MVIASNSDKIILLPNKHPEQFQLVTFVVALPSQNPDKAAISQGRPFEFELDLPSKFSVMCPFCCAGIIANSCDITEKYGHKFIGCPECKVGIPMEPVQPPAFVDPFVNPFSSEQLARCELAEIVTPISKISIDDNSLTVAEKMTRSICKE